MPDSTHPRKSPALRPRNVRQPSFSDGNSVRRNSGHKNLKLSYLSAPKQLTRSFALPPTPISCVPVLRSSRVIMTSFRKITEAKPSAPSPTSQIATPSATSASLRATLLPLKHKKARTNPFISNKTKDRPEKTNPSGAPSNPSTARTNPPQERTNPTFRGAFPRLPHPLHWNYRDLLH